MGDIINIAMFLIVFWVAFGLGYFASILKGKYKPIFIIWLLVCSVFVVIQHFLS